MSQKPPPIKVSAEGIEPGRVTMHEPDPEPGNDWPAIAGLPPFQMFISEAAPCPDGEDAGRWALQEAGKRIAYTSEAELYQAYADWHARKGYWPNETPMGGLK